MHYILYLDEFGHIGPFFSREHERFNDSPVFGLAGMLLPSEQVRDFAVLFYKLKCKLLAWDLAHKNPGNLPAYRWEKKGSAVYTVVNVEKYRELRNATNRLINAILNAGGKIFYVGEHKAEGVEFDSAELYRRQLIRAIRKVDRFCIQNQATFVCLLDEQKAGDRWRESNVEACTLAMFEQDPQQEKCRTLIEPPMQAESHLFQTLQCADWICGLIGRLAAFKAKADEYEDWEIFEKYFLERIQRGALEGSEIYPPPGAALPIDAGPDV